MSIWIGAEAPHHKMFILNFSNEHMFNLNKINKQKKNYMFLDLYIIAPVAIIIFCAFQGFFGNSVRKFMQFILNPIVLEYLVIVGASSVICLVLYFLYFFK